jgi:flagellar biosynthesis GTPase FlhF
MTKVCIRCENELPATEEYFCKDKKQADGLFVYCRACREKYMKEYYNKNKEHLLKNAKEYAQKNNEHKKEYNKEYHQKNKERLNTHKKEYKKRTTENTKESRKRYYNANKDKVKEGVRKYKQENADKVKECKKQYNLKHSESIKQYQKQYRLNNSEEKRIHNRKRKALKRQLLATYDNIQWEKTLKYFSDKCAYCGEEKPLIQEHFIALSKGGEYTHNNIIPACQSCNVSKYNKDFFVWYKEQSFYSKAREKKILRYLNYKNGIQQLRLII